MSKAGKTSNSNYSTEKKSNSTVIYKCKDINLKNLVISELNRSGTQPMAYINYTNTKLNAETKILVQSGKFKLTGGGIPRLSKPEDKNKYYETDDKREFIKIPLDPEFHACTEMRQLFEKVDEYFSSEEFRKKFFGKKFKKYQYQKCIRTPQTNNDDSESEDESGDEDKKNKKNTKNKKSDRKEYPVFDFIKMKFNVIQEGDGRVNRTKLTRVDGKKKYQVTAKTITEIANEIKFLSELRIVYYFNKIWANNTSSPGSSLILYGVGIKVMAIEYTPPPNRGINPDDIAFMSEEDDGTDDSSTKKSRENKKPVKLDSDSDSDDDASLKKSKGKKPSKDDDDSEEEVKPVKNSKGKIKEESPRKAKGKKSSKNDDDDDEDAEETDPVDEDEDEDEDEVKPSKSSKGKIRENTNKKSKNSKVEDEDEDEDEEITPKKKTSKSRSSSKK